MIRMHFIGISLLTTLFLSISAWPDVNIVSPDNDFANAYAQRLSDDLTDIEAFISNEPIITKKTQVIIALGASYVNRLSTQTSIPVIHVISSIDKQKSYRENHAFVYTDPSPAQIASFLSKSFPNSRIGYIYTDNETSTIDELKSLLSSTSTTLIAKRFSGNIFSDVRSLIKKRSGINAMLISRNQVAYDPSKIRFVLESLFRKRIPAISTSESLISAGASVAIFPKSSKLAEEIVKLTTRIHKSGTISSKDKEFYVNEIDIKINLTMSKYFNLNFEGATP